MDGVLIVDKPAGLTSHDVVARVRRSLGERRVGHTGTLDPLATGVLVVLVGRATRLAQFLSGAEKEYEALIRFGYSTDTGDVTGKPLTGEARKPLTSEAGKSLSSEHIDESAAAGNLTAWGREEIEAALAALRGEIDQVPPMYSAKKMKGKKLYELARRGVEVEREPVRVTIHELEALSLDEDLSRRNEDGTRDLHVRVVCSAGTYVRTLAETIGERLGTPAHLAALRRTRAGDFRIEDALTLEELAEKAAEGDKPSLLLSTDAALSRLPFLHLTAEEARAARNGMALRAEGASAKAWRDGERVRLRDGEGELLGVAVYDRAAGRLRPRVVLWP
ncbi:MAG TPA: tRNA pseudouridine(55) synthase TruB [Pyrinomonadaceae bacterium]|jgi:tRNA pseudouridine55 synthase